MKNSLFQCLCIHLNIWSVYQPTNPVTFKWAGSENMGFNKPFRCFSPSHAGSLEYIKLGVYRLVAREPQGVKKTLKKDKKTTTCCCHNLVFVCIKQTRIKAVFLTFGQSQARCFPPISSQYAKLRSCWL